MKFIIHTDGGARGNPGPAAVGVVIEQYIETVNNKQKTKVLREFGKRIGETTNNVAEYTAVIEALKKVESLKSKARPPARQVKIEIHFFLDSNLVVQQLNGKFKVKDSNLRKLFLDIRVLEGEIGGEVTYAYVPREQNRRADYLVNQALDAGSSCLVAVK